MTMVATTRGHLLLPCTCIVVSLLLLVTASASTPPTLLHGALRPAGAGEPSAYEMLEGFGFPRGILPAGVTGYWYRPSDGAFEVYLGGAGAGDCEFEVNGGYRLTYRRTISGNVEGGSIRNLAGVSVRMFLLNWAIQRVVVDDPGRILTFYVGPVTQAFPADGFEESPECRRRGGGGLLDDVAAM